MIDFIRCGCVRKNVLTESNANRAGPKVPLETGGFAAGDEVSGGHVRIEHESGR
ncbi:hypothetical protein [Natronorubrum thiooxidans]|uniref:hypothetical protein n=1 Tax=Natronorubrum thiooxidans TaxID=308853 RepID=UPI00135661AC|nr:hypothetical protein [Natronorubrum thiooxidans]